MTPEASTVIGVAVLRRGRVLAARRAAGSGSGGWEFPGGKVEPGESPTRTAVRELAEELGIEVAVIGWLAGTAQIREGVQLRVALAEVVAGQPVPRPGVHDAVRWLGAEELDSITWLPADLPFVTELSRRGLAGPD